MITVIEGLEERGGGEGRGEEIYKIMGMHGYVLVGEQSNKANRREEALGLDRVLDEWRRREEIHESELFH